MIMKINNNTTLLDNVGEMRTTIRIETESDEIRRLVKIIEQKINRNYFLEHTFVDLIKFGFSCWKIDDESGEIIGENVTRKCEAEMIKLMDRSKVIYCIDYAENPYSLVYHSGYKSLIRGSLAILIYVILQGHGYTNAEVVALHMKISID